jgi:hypothetical protein
MADAGGNVFPFVRDPEHGVLYAIDVYDAEGQFIGAGLMPRISWFAARDEFVYGIENDANEEAIVVRYRMELPF